MEKLPLSVSIVSYNEELNIGRTLASIAGIAAEIVVVDAFSQDRTAAIAGEYGATVFTEEWKGFTQQKNSALAKCSNDWVLCLDCDEELNPELKESIKNAIENDDGDFYYLNRKTFYLGRLLKHSWQPDRKIRLVRRSANPVWEGLNPHDTLVCKGKGGNLGGYVIHYSYRDLAHHFRKTIDYAKISAGSYFDEGKKFSYFKLLINPIFNGFKVYILNRAFLDGTRGFIAGFSAFAYTLLKYFFLWELYRGHSNDNQ